ncbi:integrase_H2C2 domain-containing protein [Trichonephila clavipes]|nr:integrase_H2C2 domain-containing protein [Trichonephila clavipes]
MAERKFDLRGWEHSNPSDPIASPTNVMGMIWDRHCDTLSLNSPDLRELMEEELEYLKHVQVSRWLHCDSGFQHISLHFFCDASKLDYSAVVFLRVDIGSTVHIQLVQSKTRIAPCGKKETTIARLELLGAAISAPWLKREELWGAFVCNSVQEIQKLTPVKAWRHVPGSLNPADCPSRGCSAKQLCISKWWEGPSWLHLSSQEWPISNVEVDVNEVEVNKERRAIVTSMMNVQTTDIKSDYFSTYSRNNRVLVWILRFIHNISNATKLKGSLGYEEFKRAEVLVFKSLQSNTFQDERLLAKMQAFKDEDGLLRIRTKLAESYEKEDFKFPILLPANDVVVKLIREEHVKAMYAGYSILRVRLREKFWIRAKRLVKQVLSECVICKRYKAKHVEVPFALLPRDRVNQTRILEVTGVDYAGPLYLKSKAKMLREDRRQKFRNEYLALLVHRGTRRNDALEVGDAVLIGHGNMRRIDWPLGGLS